jgi:hypothetical protein
MEQAPVPLQPAPDHPANVDVSDGVAVSVTTSPCRYDAVQSRGALFTVQEIDPVPVPFVMIARVRGRAVNVAVTVRFVSIATSHAPLPVHAPDQPANADPGAGVGTTLTVAPCENLRSAWHG